MLYNRSASYQVWTVEEWKEWIIIYGKYINALRSYLLHISSQENSTVVVIRQEIENAKILAGDSLTANDMLVLWQAKFDNYTKAQLLEELMESKVYFDFVAWLQSFFGEQGFITLHFAVEEDTQGEQSGGSGSGQSFNLTKYDQIKQWIKEQLDKEVQTCQERQCNATNEFNQGEV